MKKIIVLLFLTIIISSAFVSSNFIFAQTNPYLADTSAPKPITGMSLVWNDEFNIDGKPNSTIWKYEQGFVRNQELQWYQTDNANCANGVLIIEGRKEKVIDPNYVQGSDDWRKSREFAEYTSSSINTNGQKQFQFGRFEIRARINTSKGAWPAIWTLGINGEWPACGEIDLMEYYPVKNVPTILANTAWGTSQQWIANWNSKQVPLSKFTTNDTGWVNKFHIWRMDWNKDTINLYLDDTLLNTTLLSQTLNADGSNPFLHPHYILLNLALGSNGGDPSSTVFPIKYEIDYVRIYQTQGTGVQGMGAMPEEFKLLQNYPNPFNPGTMIQYTLKSNGKVRLSVYDLIGREVTVLVNNEKKAAGKYEVSFNSANLSGGIYFYRLQTDNFVGTNKMVLIK